MAPPADAREVWARLDENPPTVVVVLTPHHIRDVDLFVERYHARGFGPRLFFRHNIPSNELEPIEPQTIIPGGLTAVHDGRGRNETPLWLSEHRALVFADDVRGTPQGLRIWEAPWHVKRTLPAMRALLELPFEHVLTSHGDPLHDRAAFERALEASPSSNEDQANRSSHGRLPW
jgi:hypothetical protein